MSHKQDEKGRILLEGIPNARDLGVYKTKDGHQIKPRRLIRSGCLTGMTEADTKILTEDYELRAIVDFRTAAELSEKPDPTLPGVTYMHNPILNEAQMGMTHEEKAENKGLLDFLVELIQTGENGPEQFMSDLYAQLVLHEETVRRYRTFFDAVLNNREGALLWHCSAGKDRAGMGAVYLLWALGVSEPVIRADYLLTDRYLEKNLNRMIAHLAETVPDEKVLNGVRIMNTARESYLNRLYAEVDRHYGSMDAFLREGLGLGEEEKRELRENYLE